jgi:glycosyltransferase involved in cell wall biosynthesis
VSGPTRVLWLTKGLGRGGTEQLLLTGAGHVDLERYTVDVAYLLPHKDALVRALEARGVPVHCLHQRSSRDLSWVPRLKALVRERGYDVVHTHMPVPAVAARLVLRDRCAVIHTEHNVWGRYRRPTRWANAATFRRNDAVVAVSQAVADSMASRRLPRPPATTEVLLHGIDRAALPTSADRREARRLLGIPLDAFVVGTVGNLTAKKDHATLLRAARELANTCPTIRVVLVGAGPLEAELRARVDALGLQDHVVMTGSRADVHVLLAGFDVFCLSSLYEGLPIAMLEAMARAVPVVSTDVGGVREAVRHDVDGLLVPSADHRALAAALRRVMDDPALSRRLAAAARLRSGAFDIGTAVRRLEALYDEVVARR